MRAGSVDVAAYAGPPAATVTAAAASTATTGASARAAGRRARVGMVGCMDDLSVERSVTAARAPRDTTTPLAHRWSGGEGARARALGTRAPPRRPRRKRGAARPAAGIPARRGPAHVTRGHVKRGATA